MDIYNGEIVAYKIDDKQDQSLVNDTLNQIDIPEGCILHSDQGSVYTSYAYYQLCEEKALSEVCPEREHLPITPR